MSNLAGPVSLLRLQNWNSEVSWHLIWSLKNTIFVPLINAFHKKKKKTQQITDLKNILIHTSTEINKSCRFFSIKEKHYLLCLAEGLLPKLDILNVLGPRINTLPSMTALIYVLLTRSTIRQYFKVDFSNEASY